MGKDGIWLSAIVKDLGEVEKFIEANTPVGAWAMPNKLMYIAMSKYGNFYELHADIGFLLNYSYSVSGGGVGINWV